MKKILLSLAAVGAIAAAASPAAAQSWPGYGPPDAGRPYQDRYDGYRGPDRPAGYVDNLDWKINNAAREGRISWDEARELHGEFRDVQPIAWRVRTGRASRWEAVRLDRTLAHIERAVSRDGWHGPYDGSYGWRR